MSDYIKIAKTAVGIISLLWRRYKQRKVEKQLKRARRKRAEAEAKFRSRHHHVKKLEEIQQALKDFDSNKPLRDELKDMRSAGL